MKKFFLILILAGCAAGSRATTMEGFYEIDLSDPASQVIATLGKPYAIHQKEGGYVEYEYVERVQIGGRYAEERHYFILMKDGQVVSKRVKQSSPLPYGFDSYEMQTTQTN